MSAQSTEPSIEANGAWWVYLVQTAQGALYCGVSKDVERRFREHESSSSRSAKALRGKGPLSLVFQSLVGEHGDALRVERQIKKLTPYQKRQLIAGSDPVCKGWINDPKWTHC